MNVMRKNSICIHVAQFMLGGEGRENFKARFSNPGKGYPRDGIAYSMSANELL